MPDVNTETSEPDYLRFDSENEKRGMSEEGPLPPAPASFALLAYILRQGSLTYMTSAKGSRTTM